jgi:hypothetical protein
MRAALVALMLVSASPALAADTWVLWARPAVAAVLDGKVFYLYEWKVVEFYETRAECDKAKAEKAGDLTTTYEAEWPAMMKRLGFVADKVKPIVDAACWPSGMKPARSSRP